jgi:regulator of extracellular matrix RemA (YlzA/DUF370 family)
MAPFLYIQPGLLLDTARIVAVMPSRSEPVKRFIRVTSPGRVLNLQHGYSRRSVILLENGQLVYSSLRVEQLRDVLATLMEVIDVQPD